MELKEDKTGVGVNQSGYVRHIVERFRLEKATEAPTQIPQGWDTGGSPVFPFKELFQELGAGLESCLSSRWWDRDSWLQRCRLCQGQDDEVNRWSVVESRERRSRCTFNSILLPRYEFKFWTVVAFSSRLPILFYCHPKSSRNQFEKTELNVI